VKTVAPGGIKADFAGRSLVVAEHPAYAALMARVLGVFMDPARTAGASTAEQIAEVAWEAATDGKDQVRHVAGEDARAMYAQRLSAWVEAFRHMIGKTFLG